MMKTKILLMALTSTMCVTTMATEKNDTVVFSSPTKVTVMTNDSVQKIKVTGKKGDEIFRYEKTVAIDNTKTSTKVIKKLAEDDEKWVLDVGYGWAAPTNTPDGHGFAVFRSNEWFFGVRYCYTPKGATQTYSTGLWCDWRSYVVPTGKVIGKNADGIVGFSKFPENYKKTESEIRIFSLSVPFLFTQKFGKDSKTSVSLGPVVNFNLRGRINNEWTDGDYEMEESIKGIGYRPVTVDFMGILKYHGLGLYCKYSPMSVLKDKTVDGVENPKFKSLTFGLFF